jgi:hypothetical protein
VGGACSPNGKKRNERRLLVGKPRRRCKWVDDIKMDLVALGWSGMNWIGLAQDRYKLRALVNSVMNFRVP